MPFFKEKRFKFITKFANTIPIYTITVPKDMNRLHEVYDEICIHTKSLKDHT
ncbi:MAG: hypothetical protein U9N30_06255 [Campylobacterota bacterium]|nr:hypothetical protein [Campylobacterota bacterium]